ncbi:ABC transporter permease [uncultured Brevundimonas sp.]|uniref:ABC transporter permease n=1 Tax=uncultured Brevundimonas sp. TaxID=213418 RepID=UPI00260A864B|nr:ABC transporter permease [uncultured Brevundimonas sp.]
MVFAPLTRHLRIIASLMMREVITRFGREGLGFAWLIAEPLLFCFGVMGLWSLTKPAYEHGVRLAPFVMTAYMSLILCRHLIGFLSGALQANMGLLYHRQISPLHIFTARIVMELGGATAAFAVVYAVLFAIGEVRLPYDYMLLYAGWFILAWVAAGFALVLAGLAMRFDVFERFIGLISYLLIPLSGAFTMVAWAPPAVQKFLLYIPFVHPIEMVRAAVFGEFVETHYNAIYAVAWGTVFNIIGLALVLSSREKIETE